MDEITIESLKRFFYAPKKKDIEKEAGLQQGYITKIIKGERPLTKETIEKLKPILKKYQF